MGSVLDKVQKEGKWKIHQAAGYHFGTNVMSLGQRYRLITMQTVIKDIEIDQIKLEENVG